MITQQRDYIGAQNADDLQPRQYMSPWTALLIFLAALFFCALLSTLVGRLIHVDPGNQVNLRSGGITDVVKAKPDKTVEPVHMGVAPVPSQ